MTSILDLPLTKIVLFPMKTEVKWVLDIFGVIYLCRVMECVEPWPISGSGSFVSNAVCVITISNLYTLDLSIYIYI